MTTSTQSGGSRVFQMQCNNAQIALVDGMNRTVPAIPASQQLTLEATNVFGGYNDVQIRDTFTDRILERLRELEQEQGLR